MKIVARDIPPRTAWALEQAGIHPLLARLYAARGVTTRDELDDRTVVLATKDGLIQIDVLDEDPAMAAEIANAYVDELRKLTRDMALTEAQQRRVGNAEFWSLKPVLLPSDAGRYDETAGTIRNAIIRGASAPVRLRPEDFEIEETETVVRSSTVLMLDLGSQPACPLARSKGQPRPGHGRAAERHERAGRSRQLH